MTTTRASEMFPTAPSEHAPPSPSDPTAAHPIEADGSLAAEPDTESASTADTPAPTDIGAHRTAGRSPTRAPTDRREHHLIIGAGFSGLGVAATFQRHGILYDQVEATDDLGGNWYHGVYEHVHIISSRKTTQYDDIPMPASWPDFPSAAQMLEYLRNYAKHHQLRAHIEFDTRVVHVRPLITPDTAPSNGATRASHDANASRADINAAAETHHWEVTFASGEQRIYGGVVVCNGHHWDRRMPDYPGVFTGEIIHSKAYKHSEMLRDKRVLVIGGGNSACDIAVEAARVAQSAHISMRRGYWFMPKLMLGMPTVELAQPWMPLSTQRALIRSLLRTVVGPYEKYGLQHPDHKIFERHPTINSELLYMLRHGRITPHRDVERYVGQDVIFCDGSRAAFDLIVCATGYRVSFPFVADEVVTWNPNGMPNLISGLLPPDYKNIYFFGTSQPRYGAGPLISAGAEVLCTIVAVQRSLRHPVGAVLAKLGQKPPETWLQDPHRALRKLARAQSLLPRLPALERDLMGNHAPKRARLAWTLFRSAVGR